MPASGGGSTLGSERRLAVVFADLDGFTALTEVHGDLDAAEVATGFADLARGALEPGARLVKTLGDAVMITAKDVDEALQTALNVVAAVDRVDDYPTVSAGVHAGPVVERAGDVFGATVNLAARVAAHAAPGQVLCTKAVADAAGEGWGRQLAAISARQS